MIFLTVGTQLPFDRLVSTVDNMAADLNLEIVAQVGSGKYQPKCMKFHDVMEPDSVDEMFKASSVIISHAGMGSIINCLRLKKPIIIFPRLSKFGEHRNDHQMDTLKSFSNVAGVYVAQDESTLRDLLSRVNDLCPSNGLETPERDSLVTYVNSLID
ncbi:hypothetical protein L4C33_06135 [Vibrio makurazakiensis]|uniref:glycosyltransferase n=1 Tax=Vibrio makurazakiensis TaxID=2910250 RepID=UPI003D0F9872